MLQGKHLTNAGKAAEPFLQNNRMPALLLRNAGWPLQTFPTVFYSFHTVLNPKPLLSGSITGGLRRLDVSIDKASELVSCVTLSGPLDLSGPESLSRSSKLATGLYSHS